MFINIKKDVENMLQIITGKFYKSENRYHNECQAKLYSNVKIENTKQIGHIKLA